MSKTPLKKAKEAAWKAFSLYIRTRDNGKGCYTCGKSLDIKSASAGHGIGGRNGAVLFDERIVKSQCSGCNIWGRGQYQVFTRKLIAELGLDLYDEIVKHSSDVVKRKVYDYEAIKEEYEAKLKTLT
jgi:hypothetical protein